MLGRRTGCWNLFIGGCRSTEGSQMVWERFISQDGDHDVISAQAQGIHSEETPIPGDRRPPNRPSSITLQKWKEIKDQMECLNDRTWPYHGTSPCAMEVRASVLNNFWRDHVSDKYGLGGCTIPHVRRPVAAVPKATFSYAMAVMDKAEGWKEEAWVGSYLAASMWMYSKAAMCKGRNRNPPLDMRTNLAIIIESVSWVTEDFLWDHECFCRDKRS